MNNTYHQQEKQERLLEKLRRECGPIILEALADPKIIEIMLNPDGRIWMDHLDKGMFDSGHCMSPMNATNLIGTVADLRGKLINEQFEILETEFPLDGSRFEAEIPDVVPAPSFCLRKKAIRVFTLADYVKSGVMNEVQAACIRKAIISRRSLLIVGGPGTGKTTLANAILDEMVRLGDPNQRFVILEDTRELQCNAHNHVLLKTTKNVNFQQLLRVALRSRPDKICMGECRGAEMLTLLKAWNTGTPGGLATVHANSAEAALVRITEMIEEAGSLPQPRLVCESVNVIVSISLHKEKGRLIDDVLEVTGFKDGHYQFSSLIFTSQDKHEKK